MGQGWICLHRKIRDCTLIWDDKPFSRGQAWIDLLLQVNHEDREILFNGTYKKIERGQTLTSIRKLSEQWGWSRKKTTKFLNELKMGHMLSLESNNKSTTITVVNYRLYQDRETTKEPQKSHKRTSEEHQRNTNNNDITMNNNDKQKDSPSEKTQYDFSKHSNVDNVIHVLNSKEYINWEYIYLNQKLYICIKEWMEYKDAKKPKKNNHYANQISLTKLLDKFVKSSKEYGVQAVVDVVNDSIAGSYMGIVWDWVPKRAETKPKQEAKSRYADALERMNKHMEERTKEIGDVDVGDFY